MTTNDSAFAGSIPGLYDRFLGPLLFEPYAKLAADRARALRPRRILETAAGTGIVTEALHQALPDAEIVATDLNQAMLEVAAGRIGSDEVVLQVADAQELPFSDGEFDLVVCQFGVMFYPDRVRGNAEARRVLREGGHYLLLVWDTLAKNPVSNTIHGIVGDLFPDDPPQFLARTPYGYADRSAIERDLRAAGFSSIEIETVAAAGTMVSGHDAVQGLVAGSPLRGEIEERDPAGVDRVVEKVSVEIGDGSGLDTSLSAHIVTATR